MTSIFKVIGLNQSPSGRSRIRRSILLPCLLQLPRKLLSTCRLGLAHVRIHLCSGCRTPIESGVCSELSVEPTVDRIRSDCRFVHALNVYLHTRPVWKDAPAELGIGLLRVGRIRIGHQAGQLSGLAICHRTQAVIIIVTAVATCLTAAIRRCIARRWHIKLICRPEAVRDYVTRQEHRHHFHPLRIGASTLVATPTTAVVIMTVPLEVWRTPRWVAPMAARPSAPWRMDVCVRIAHTRVPLRCRLAFKRRWRLIAGIALSILIRIFHSRIGGQTK